MKPRVYIETSVVSYLTAQSNRDLIVAAHQQITIELWERCAEFEFYASALAEQSGTDPEVSPHLSKCATRKGGLPR